jgi:hypothetical protein
MFFLLCAKVVIFVKKKKSKYDHLKLAVEYFGSSYKEKLEIKQRNLIKNNVIAFH